MRICDMTDPIAFFTHSLIVFFVLIYKHIYKKREWEKKWLNNNCRLLYLCVYLLKVLISLPISMRKCVRLKMLKCVCFFFQKIYFISFIVLTYRLFSELNKIESGLRFKLNAILNIIQMENALNLSAGVVFFVLYTFCLFILHPVWFSAHFSIEYIGKQFELKTFYALWFFFLLNTIAWERTFFTHWIHSLILCWYFYDVSMCMPARTLPNVLSKSVWL